MQPSLIMDRATNIALAVSLALIGAVSLAPRATRSQTSSLESFDGTWVLGNTARNRRDIEQGIDLVADQMNLFIREIARGEMHRRIRSDRRITLGVESETRVSLTIDAWGPHGFEIGAAMTRVPGPAGTPIRAAINFRRGRLIEREIHGQGNRTNVFSLSGDESRMTVAARIGSDQLPDDVRYRLTYTRLR